MPDPVHRQPDLPGQLLGIRQARQDSAKAYQIPASMASPLESPRGYSMVLSFMVEDESMAVRVRKDDEARVPAPVKQLKPREARSAAEARDPRVAGLQGMGYAAAAERLKPGKDGAAQPGLQTDHPAGAEKILRLYLLPRLEPAAADKVRTGLNGTLKSSLLNELVQVLLGSADSGRRLLELAAQGDASRSQLDVLAVQLHASISESLEVIRKWLASHLKALAGPERKTGTAPAPGNRKRDDGLLDQPSGPQTSEDKDLPAVTKADDETTAAGKTPKADPAPKTPAPGPDKKTRRKTPA